MSRGHHSSNKRQREADRARKKEEKAQRRLERRERGRGEIPVVAASDLIGDVDSDQAMAEIERRAQEARSASSIPARLFVGGLSDETTEADLRTAFGAIAPVAEAVVVLDRGTRTPRGFGFVTMRDRKDAQRVIAALNGSELNGRTIVVDLANARAR